MGAIAIRAIPANLPSFKARLLSLPRGQRLAALLEDSRKFQNEVSERLAEQVLHALYELLRGFQAAHDASGGTPAGLLGIVLVNSGPIKGGTVLSTIWGGR